MIITSDQLGPSVELSATPVARAEPGAAGPPAPRRSPRVASLDGLRGLAAVLVLLHHCLVAIPFLDGTVLDAGFAADPAFAWVYTPLHSLWAGGELVYVFFVLSGLVLTWPYLAGKPLRYGIYLRARLTRLYLPALGSLVVAAVILYLLPRRAVPGMAAGLKDEVGPLTLEHLLRSATLVMQATHLNFSLWSIRWEVFFSVLLPVYVLLARRVDVRGWRLAAGIAVCGATCGLGELLHQGALLYLPMFAVGALLARRLTQPDGPRGFTPRAAPALFALGWLALSAHWWLGVWLPPLGAGPVAALVVAGATAVVVSAIGFRPFAWFLERPPLQFAGRISFSLYVTHMPLVFGLAFWLGPARVGILPLLAVPLSLLLAFAFHRCVEAPSHRLAGRLGRSR